MADPIEVDSVLKNAKSPASLVSAYTVQIALREEITELKKDNSAQPLPKKKLWLPQRKNTAALKINEQNINAETFDSKDLSQSDIKKSEFKNCVFRNINFKKSQIHACTFIDVTFIATRFTQVFMQGNIFLNCSFLNVDLSKADLSWTRFEKCNFETVSFHKSVLELVSFSSSDLTHAINLKEWSLAGCTIDAETLLPEYISEKVLNNKKVPRNTYPFSEVFLGNSIIVIFTLSILALILNFTAELEGMGIIGSTGLVFSIIVLALLSKHVSTQNE